MGDQELPEDEHDRPRPRVVDKRVSARGAAPPPPPPAAADHAPAEPRPPGDEAARAPSTPAPAPPSPPADPGTTAGDRTETPPGERVWTPEQEAEARRLAEDIARVPSQDWVISAAMNLVNVAGVKLERGNPAEAQLAIDALAGLVNAVGPRLGDVEATFRQLVAQLQMAYAEVVSPPPEPS